MADALPRNTPGAGLVLRRRSLLLAATAIGARGMFGTRAMAANAAEFPDAGTILVGGPEGGALSLLADRLIAALRAGQPNGMALHSKPTGGADGVTGANQFEARVAPDGQTALLVPGAAATAWLVGDPRAQYDVARWLPLMAGVTPGLVCSRLALASLRPGAVVRMAASGPVGPDLPGLLAVELLGLQLAPVFGLQDHRVAAQAMQAGAVDAVFLHGPNARAHAATFAAAGAPPLFAMGTPDETGDLRRDPVLPALPTMPELAVQLRGAVPAGQLYDAWQACAAAADLQFALVLPVLTPAAVVSLWRKAAKQMAASAEAPAGDMRTVPAPGANNVLSVISAEAPILLTLRRWLAERLNWRPA